MAQPAQPSKNANRFDCMNSIAVFLFVLGALTGGGFCALFAQKSSRKLQREHAEQERLFSDTRNSLIAVNAKILQDALAALESGDVEASKGELRREIARLYHHFKDFGEDSESISYEMRRIKRLAKSLPGLASELAKRGNEN